MKRNFWIKLSQALIVTPIWIWILSQTEGLIYRTNLFNIMTYVGVIISVLSIAVPKKWAMGLNNYMKANILERVSPLVFSIAVLLLMGRLPQTYAIVLVETFFFANTICFAAYLFTDIVIRKVLKFVGKRR